MKTQTRHIARLVMRTAYTATAFFSAILTAIVSHDGVQPNGRLLQPEVNWIVSAAVCWALAVSLDGLTSEPSSRRGGSHV